MYKYIIIINNNMKIIVAKDQTNGIGLNNQLPWKCKEDMRRFSILTKGNNNNAVIMGRKTWDSIPIKPLINRHNIIISQSTFEYSLKNECHYDDEVKNTRVSFFKSIDSAINWVSTKNYDDTWIIGGEKIYNTFLNEEYYNSFIELIYVTEIIGDFMCDTFFSDLEKNNNYELISSENFEDKAIFKIYKNKKFCKS